LKVSQPAPQPFQSLARWINGRLRQWRDDPHRELLAYAGSELETVRRMRASRQAKAERERALKKERARDRTARAVARQGEIDQFRAVKRAQEEAAARRAAR
jgi:hypothetical protein